MLEQKDANWPASIGLSLSLCCLSCTHSHLRTKFVYRNTVKQKVFSPAQRSEMLSATQSPSNCEDATISCIKLIYLVKGGVN